RPPALSLLLRRQIKSHRLMLKMPLMRPITKRLVLRPPTPANAHYLPAPEPIGLPILVYDLKIPFYLDRSVVVDSNLYRGHNYLIFKRQSNVKNHTNRRIRQISRKLFLTLPTTANFTQLITLWNTTTTDPANARQDSRYSIG